MFGQRPASNEVMIATPVAASAKRTGGAAPAAAAETIAIKPR